MKLDKAARAILSVTALAWSIPLAQAAETRQPGVPEAQANSAEFKKLDANSDGVLSFKETALPREDGLDSLDVSVETFDNEVLLSGFVQDAEQKKKALLVASDVEGVKDVKDGLQVLD